MAHDLATTNGRTAMFYHGETPWHRLGTKLDNPATAAEAISAAGLGYDVALTALTTIDGTPVPQRKAVVRADSHTVLGVVGNNYVPIQNHECFGFLDAVVAEGGLRYHTAGALGKGERIWMLAKLPGHLRVKSSDDITEKYLLLSNSHDGSSALRVFFTPIRVVCANTLAVADRRGQGQGIAIQHTGDLAAKVHEAQRVLGFAHRFYDDLQGQINRLASYYPTRDQLASYFEALYPDPAIGSTTRAQNTRESLHRLFEVGRGQDTYEPRRHRLGGPQRRDRVRRPPATNTWRHRLAACRPTTAIAVVRVGSNAQATRLALGAGHGKRELNIRQRLKRRTMPDVTRTTNRCPQLLAKAADAARKSTRDSRADCPRRITSDRQRAAETGERRNPGGVLASISLAAT